MLKPVSIIITTLVVIILLPGCEKQKKIEPSGKTISIGVIGSFTGDNNHVGTSGLHGIKTFLKVSPYLINGDQVKLLIKDDKSNPKDALKTLKELAEQDKVSAVLLLSDSSIALEIADKTDGEIPIIATLATHPEVTNNDKNIVQLSFDDYFQSVVAAMFSRDELLVDKAAVFVDKSSEHSEYQAETFAKKFLESGGVITSIAEINEFNETPRQIVEKLQQMNTELIYVPVDHESVLRIATAVAESNWEPLAIGSDGLLTQILLTHKDQLDVVHDLMTTDVFTSQQPITKLGKVMVKTYKDEFGDTGSTFAGLGVESMWLLTDMLEICLPEPSAECLTQTMKKGFTFQGLLSPITIGTDGKAVRPVFVNAIKNNKQVLKVKVY